MSRYHLFIHGLRLSVIFLSCLLSIGLGQVVLDQRSNGVDLGDVNGDGVLDLVIATNTFNLVCLGDPTLKRITRSQCDSVSESVLKSNDVALGDLNEDGHLDAVFANGDRSEPQRNRVCLGDGSGDFTCLLVDSGIRTSQAVALGDLNRDGHLDAVFANDSLLIRTPNHICFGDGSNRPFSDDRCEIFGDDISRSRDVALGDVNRDGRLDVLFVGINARQLCTNNRNGGFNCNNISTDTLTTQAVFLRDLNKDGQLDVIFAVEGAPNEVCLGNGTRAFACEIIDPLVSNGTGIDVSDLNNDGQLDIIFSSRAASRSNVERNRVCFGNGHATFQCDMLEGDDDGGNDVALGDVNQDGRLDAVFARAISFADSADRVCFGNGNPQPFVAIKCNLIGSDAIDSRAVAIKDVNADGHQDIVLANNNGRNWLCLGHGKGDFFNNLSECEDISVQVDDSLGVAIADINNDGSQDVVFANGNFNGQQNEICFGISVAQFSAENCVNVSNDAFGSESVKLIDINTDGLLDLIFFNPSSIDQHRLCLNQTTEFSCENIGLDDDREAAFADLNNDGQIDVVVDADMQHQVCLGNGSLELIEPSRCQSFGVAQSPNKQVALGDINSDGFVDAVFPNQVCLGNGSEIPFDDSDCANINLGRVRKIVLADLNMDGLLDGIVVNSELNQICAGRGGVETFSEENCQDITTAVRRSVDVAVADVNEDGFIDAIFVNGPFELNQVCLGNADAMLLCENVSDRLPNTD